MTTTTLTPDLAPRGLGLVDHLLREPAAVLDRIDRGEELRALARTLTLTIVVAAAVAGAALGAYRGGVQVLYAAVKLPLVVLLTAGLCTPAFSALNAAVLGRADLRRDLALVLATLALGSMLLAATAPLLLLAMSLGAAYHQTTLLAVACCAAAGAGGLGFFIRAQRRRGKGRGLVSVALLLLFATVGAQMTWTLRPYLVRPRTPETPFVRALEGSFLEAVRVSADSARGRFRRDAAPLPGAASDLDPEGAGWRYEEAER